MDYYLPGIDRLQYSAEGGAVVVRNGPRFNNRPLYCNHMPVFVLAGDRPFLRFAGGHYVNGILMLALLRGGEGAWLHEASDVLARYQGGCMEWEVRDARFGEAVVRLRAAPLAEGPGFAAQAIVEGARPGDRLVWAYGAARQFHNRKLINASWALDALGSPEIVTQGFDPRECRGNRVALEDGMFRIQPPAYEPELNLPAQTVMGCCSASSDLRIADAADWRDLDRFLAGAGGELPIVCGVIPADEQPEAWWAVRSLGPLYRQEPFDPLSPCPSVAPCDEQAARTELASPRALFDLGRRRVADVARQAVVDTPDARLNAVAAASCVAVDAIWDPPAYAHGAMRWNTPLLGWRSMFGGIAYGWHDRVKAHAAHCCARQITASDNALPRANPQAGGASQAPDSRFYGRGYVTAFHPRHYDMQSQFFDQLLHDWRYTADPELERVLRPALELHCEWMRDCFDPDDDGLYESYINTWPTDSQWYNGGGTAEETAYAFRAHQAARDMARRAGDTEAAERHQARLAKIQRGLMEQLWLPAKGHIGSYREQEGHRRVHENPWLYSIFLPIDAGMLAPLQAAQALHFTEWGLENVRPAYGGRRVWTSNWVPKIHSVRELWTGDNYHLALAYYQAGLPEDGWDVFQAAFLTSAYASAAPGNLGHESSQIDFSDCSNMFCRALVEGIFGYQPDYPNKKVRVRPQLPDSWDRASIRTPDFGLSQERRAGSVRLTVDLTWPAALEVLLPVKAARIREVKVNGRRAAWTAEAGFGRSVLRVKCRRTRRAVVEVAYDEEATASRPDAEPQAEVVVGQTVAWAPAWGELARFEDPQGVLSGAAIRGGRLTGIVAGKLGHHLVFGLATNGELDRWKAFKVRVSDPQAEAARAAKRPRAVPAGAAWECVDISPAFNGDVRGIYQQAYLSPRPQTVSARIGSDGYAPWTYYAWDYQGPPAIDLANVPRLLDRDSRLRAPQGVPFAWRGQGRNIAFTSLWDNWPHRVTVPVGRAAEAVWLLVCGSSNPMQCGIENARLRMRYADGAEEDLALVHPDNYWTLCPLNVRPPAPGDAALGDVAQGDYDYARDGFCLPHPPPLLVQLGGNCRANLLGWALRPGVPLRSITLETMSAEVVVGLMGVTLMNPVV